MVKQIMTTEEKKVKNFEAHLLDSIEQKVQEQTERIEELMWATDKPSTEFKGIASYMQEVKPMTKEEKLINVAGLVYTLRDLLEDIDWNRELKQRTKNYAAYLDRLVREMAADRDVWQELDDLQEYFYEHFVRETKK